MSEAKDLSFDDTKEASHLIVEMTDRGCGSTQFIGPFSKDGLAAWQLIEKLHSEIDPDREADAIFFSVRDLFAP